jgi:hypothetical protein
MAKSRKPRSAVAEPITNDEWLFINDAERPENADTAVWWSLECDGGELFREGRPSIAELWASYGPAVLRDWIPKHPCTRPNLWWTFDGPDEPRDGESEASYLQRHGLLTAAERRALQLDAFAPVAIESE